MKAKIPHIAKKLAKENAIKQYSLGTGEFYESSTEPAFIDGFLAATKWIAVEDELPNSKNGYIDKIVLIKSKEGKIIETGKFSSDKNKWLYSSIANRNPSFWRPVDFL